jgi:hypothetical protein
MTQLSLSSRQAFNAETTDEFPIVLVEIIPPGATSPVRLASEPAERLSTDPLRYGIVHQGKEYGWALMALALPGDEQDSPPATKLIFENVVENMAATARNVTPGKQASVVLKLIISSAPDVIEERYEMTAIGATYNAAQVSLDISREPIETEPWPADRTTKMNFPGMYR